MITAAPRDAIETVIEKYPAIKDLIENQWLHLTAVDDGIYYHYRKSSLWCEVDTGNAQDVVAS